MGMSIQVNDFQWEPEKNDAEYIKLLESSRDEWQKIAQKAIARLKALSKTQGRVEANCEHQCNKCKFYEGVHNVMGCAPCSFWGIGGVMWNDYCSRFNLWEESEVK